MSENPFMVIINITKKRSICEDAPLSFFSTFEAVPWGTASRFVVPQRGKWLILGKAVPLASVGTRFARLAP
jgi:hypothetical protein